jgi:hypothetical protein
MIGVLFANRGPAPALSSHQCPMRPYLWSANRVQVKRSEVTITYENHEVDGHSDVVLGGLGFPHPQS